MIWTARILTRRHPRERVGVLPSALLLVHRLCSLGAHISSEVLFGFSVATFLVGCLFLSNSVRIPSSFARVRWECPERESVLEPSSLLEWASSASSAFAGLLSSYDSSSAFAVKSSAFAGPPPSSAFAEGSVSDSSLGLTSLLLPRRSPSFDEWLLWEESEVSCILGAFVLPWN